MADANLYSYWGFRMDYTPMLYLKTPGEAVASVSTLKVLFTLFMISLISLLFIIIYKKLVDRVFSSFERLRYRLVWMLVLLVVSGSLLIPIRGGFGVAPINAGAVYFSKKMFLNHTAINAVWNVGASAFAQRPVKNPYEFTDQGIRHCLS